MSQVSYNALKAANRLPSPPAVALRILQLVAAEDTTLDELAHVISADPALTAKILKYLNSPLIGLGFHGTTLAEAVARIGTRGAQLLALSFSLVSQRHLQACPSFNFNRFWSESLARAVAARRLAAQVRIWHPEEAFVAGLVLRIGQLVLATAAPAEYEPVLQAAATADALLALERERLGCDHLGISLHLLKDWKLPEAVRAAIEPLARGVASTDAARILRLADAVGTFVSRADLQGGEEYQRLSALLGENGTGERDEYRSLLQHVTQDWAAYGELLSVPTATPPDLDALELEAEEHRTTLRLAAELEVLNLRNENQQLSQLAHRDRLTGLLNRGAFDALIADAVATAERHGGALALLMLDLDRFKSINDRHGHPAGDAVLRHVARLLHSEAKTPAEAFRFGGEEFAVLVPHAGDAAALAERIREAIAASPLSEGGKSIALTVSTGIAEARWPSRPMSAAALVAEADAWLYEAKRAGGNAWRPKG